MMPDSARYIHNRRRIKILNHLKHYVASNNIEDGEILFKQLEEYIAKMRIQFVKETIKGKS